MLVNRHKEEPEMPLYEYKCNSCKHEFEQFGHVDDKLTICPECGMTGTRQLSKPNVHVFVAQHVRDIQDSNPPYVRNRQELTDAVNRFNDTELASKQGKIAAF